MNSNTPKVSGSDVTGPVNPGVQKSQSEGTEGDQQLSVGNGVCSNDLLANQLIQQEGSPAPDDVTQEVARLREENRKLREGQEQQQLLLEAMQLQIQKLSSQVFGEATEPKVATPNNDKATSGSQGNWNNPAVEVVTHPVSLKAGEDPGPTGQMVRNQVFDEAKNKVASGSLGNRNKIAVEMVTEPGSSKSEVLIPAEMKTVDKAGLCYYVLQTGSDYQSILKQIKEIDPSFLSTTGLIQKALHVKQMELNMGPEHFLRDFILPYCLGSWVKNNTNLDRNRTVWLHGPSGMGKETWVRKEFPPEMGYFYVNSSKDLKQFKPLEHKAIVAINLKMDLDHWPAFDLRTFVGSEANTYQYVEGKQVVISYGVQRIATSEQAPSEMFRVYGSQYVELMKGNMWRIIAVQVTRPIFSLIS